jgi:hypothetical protein
MAHIHTVVETEGGDGDIPSEAFSRHTLGPMGISRGGKGGTRGGRTDTIVFRS